MYKIVLVQEDLFWYMKTEMGKHKCSNSDKYLRKMLLGDENAKTP